MASKKKGSKTQETTLEGDGETPFVAESSSVKSDENVGPTIDQEITSKADILDTKQSETNKVNTTKSDKSKKHKSKNHYASPTDDWLIDRQKIKVIRERKSCFIVFIDTNEEVRWLAKDLGAASLSDDARGAISRTRLLAATPVTYLSNDQKKAWNLMIGESLALALSGNVDNAISTVEKTQNFVLSRAKETARIWFVQGSFAAFSVMLLVGVNLYFYMHNQDIDLWFHVPLA